MTAETEVQNTHWKTIIDRIKEGRCVPFLGAAANVSVKGYRGLPLGRDIALRFFEELTGLESFDPADFDPGQLADELLGKLDGLDTTDPRVVELVTSVRPRLAKLADINTRFARYADLRQLRMLDLARVALHMRVQNDMPGLLERLQKLLPDEERRPSKLLRTLAGLPIPLIITTNYDNLMERALGKRPHRVVVQPVDGFKDNDDWAELQQDLAITDDRIVYKIHGSFRDPKNSGQPSRVIITEEDYIQFLTVVGREVGGIPTPIKAMIQEGTLLFLGYGLEDWDFRTIFKGLVESLEPSERRRAFAFQKNPPDFWVKFWEKKDVTIYNVDLYEFADELENQWKKRAGRTNR
jgi:hypothetical protein